MGRIAIVCILLFLFVRCNPTESISKSKNVVSLASNEIIPEELDEETDLKNAWFREIREKYNVSNVEIWQQEIQNLYDFLQNSLEDQDYGGISWLYEDYDVFAGPHEKNRGENLFCK